MNRTMKNSPGCSNVPCTAKDGKGDDESWLDALQKSGSEKRSESKGDCTNEIDLPPKRIRLQIPEMLAQCAFATNGAALQHGGVHIAFQQGGQNETHQVTAKIH